MGRPSITYDVPISILYRPGAIFTAFVKTLLCFSKLRPCGTMFADRDGQPIGA